MNYQEVIKSITTTIFSQIQSLIKEAPFDKTFRARILKKISDGKYQIEYKGGKYTAKSSQSYDENDIVYVCAPMNKWEELFILSV